MSYFRQFMLLALGPLDKVKDYMDKELLDETKLEEKFLDWELDAIQQGKVKDWIGYFKRTSGFVSNITPAVGNFQRLW